MRIDRRSTNASWIWSDPRAAARISTMFVDAATLRIALHEIELHFIDNVSVISDPPEKALRDRNERWLKNMLSPLVIGASRNIEITSPYFVPRKESAKALVGLVKSGVDVAILTNSLAATDVAAVHSGYARQRPQLIKGGVRLFELQPHGRASDISLFGSKRHGPPHESVCR